MNDKIIEVVFDVATSYKHYFLKSGQPKVAFNENTFTIVFAVIKQYRHSIDTVKFNKFADAFQTEIIQKLADQGITVKFLSRESVSMDFAIEMIPATGIQTESGLTHGKILGGGSELSLPTI